MQSSKFSENSHVRGTRVGRRVRQSRQVLAAMERVEDAVATLLAAAELYGNASRDQVRPGMRRDLLRYGRAYGRAMDRLTRSRRGLR